MLNLATYREKAGTIYFKFEMQPPLIERHHHSKIWYSSDKRSQIYECMKFATLLFLLISPIPIALPPGFFSHTAHGNQDTQQCVLIICTIICTIVCTLTSRWRYGAGDYRVTYIIKNNIINKQNKHSYDTHRAILFVLFMKIYRGQ